MKYKKLLLLLILLLPSVSHAAVTWDSSNKSTNITLSGGNLTAASTQDGSWGSVDATVSKSSGKWYWEYHVDSATSGHFAIQSGITLAFHASPQDTVDGWSYYYSGSKVHNSTPVAYGSSYTQGDTIGIRYDATNGVLGFLKNNIDQGDAYTGLSGAFFPYVAILSDPTFAAAVTANFGATAFTYTPPAGYSGLDSSSVSSVQNILGLVRSFWIF